jgi:site-specific DNA recombinase
MSNLKMNNQLSEFVKQSNKLTWRTGNDIVSYTRVSSFDQNENTSLATQKKSSIEYASRRSMQIIEFFGGTYESAKTDERKEFKRMLEFVKKNKNIGAILVYSYERFSRSDNAAILSRELAKIGVKVLSVFQDVDVTSASGQLQQDIFYAFGNYDNILRRDKSSKGMSENMRNGYWVTHLPFGYTNLKPREKAKNHIYIINKDGEILKLGFKWKAEGKLNNLEIVEKMQKLGSSIKYKSFVRIISNPFYCGYVTHGLIPGEIHKGKHPSLVSEQLFLKANTEADSNPHKGISKKVKIVELPLKSFVKDEATQRPFTGYIKKGIYYYKTRGIGSAVNERADIVNKLFQDELSKFTLAENSIKQVELNVKTLLTEKMEEQLKEVSIKKRKLTELHHKLEALELRFVNAEINSSLFEKYSKIFEEEKKQLADEIDKSSFNSSNLDKAITKAIQIARKPLQLWQSSDYDDKQILQYLIFPEGLWYNKEKKVVRTPRVNTVFSAILSQIRVTEKNKNGRLIKNDHHSCLVERTGIEPVIPP